MAEKNAYETLRNKVLIKSADRIDRVENVLVDGTPDVNYCIEGTEGWIEIKCPTEPKRSTTPLFGSNHKLSQDQKNWIKRQLDAGGIVWVVIRTDYRWAILSGRLAEGINLMTVQDLIDSAHHTFPHPNRDKYHWLRLRMILARRWQ